jgi:hypothetical protein
VWKVVSKSTDILGYVRCSYAWLDLVQKYYSEREMYVLLGNLSQRLEETYSLESRAEVNIPSRCLCYNHGVVRLARVDEILTALP